MLDESIWRVPVAQYLPSDVEEINHYGSGGIMVWSPSGIVVSYVECRTIGLGSKLGEDMSVCKCLVPSLQGVVRDKHRAASPLERLVDRDESYGERQVSLSHNEFRGPRSGLSRSDGISNNE
ncbi:hypothetical protein TNCV_2476891 [Trichonephila clavipes]|nr:hypothetical protein TNCV_2476891 [Trichonephila clavipes]